MIQKILYINDIYKNIEDYNPNKKRKILIVFDDMIAEMISNKNLNPVVTGLFIRGRKLNFSLAYITQSYFAVSKNIRLNSTNNFFTKIINKKDFQKLHLITYQILALKALWIFNKKVLQNHVLFWLLIPLLHQINL